MTDLLWTPLDSLKYKPGGGEVSHAEFKAAHDALIKQDQWIVDGFGSLDTVWERLAIADTLLYLDMSVLRQNLQIRFSMYIIWTTPFMCTSRLLHYHSSS